MSESRRSSDTLDSESGEPGLKDLRAAIPLHCFQAHTLTTLSYIIRDLALTIGLAYTALKYIEPIANPYSRFGLWNLYGFAQGLVFTGIWIIAHECGHGAMFNNKIMNDSFGLLLHSFVGVPYYSWKYSHARHHRYTNHMEKDTAFVPARESEFRATKAVADFFEIAEDAPFLNFLFLLGHQVIGWPLYMLTNITSGPKSDPNKKKITFFNSHLDPLASMFSPSQRLSVLISDLGLACVGVMLYVLSKTYNWTTIAWLYGLPYLWVNHWIGEFTVHVRALVIAAVLLITIVVMITFLHHTHPDTIHYESDTWTFQKGALATVDRDFGFIGRHLFHGIIEFHVIHHLFPRIPFYYAEEATQHVKELLGEQYLRTETNLLADFWRTFINCTYVVQNKHRPGELCWAQPGALVKKQTI